MQLRVQWFDLTGFRVYIRNSSATKAQKFISKCRDIPDFESDWIHVSFPQQAGCVDLCA